MSAHECHAGPLCAFYFADVEIADDRQDCEHESCAEMMHESCPACFVEAMEALAAQAALDAPLLEGKCPEDGKQISIGHPFGAPGVGCSAYCSDGHAYSYVAGAFHRLESEMHILTLADVI
jgi:hypothetical protein